MIRAYDECYRSAAQDTLGRSFDTATGSLGMGLDAYFSEFIGSGIADRFGHGDYRYITGMSGVELACLVAGRGDDARRFGDVGDGYGPDYWCGWSLAYYQWHCGRPFEEIDALVPITRVRALYDPYHEMDILQFVDRMDAYVRAERPWTNLKRRRVEMGLSQAELAALADVPVRTVQQYEQRQKGINRAGAETVARLAQVLWCPVGSLLEFDGAEL